MPLVLLFLLLLSPPLLAGTPPKLDTFPRIEQLWIGNAKAQIQPRAFLEIRAKSSGPHRFLIPSGQTLRPDQVFALVRPERIALERRLLANQRTDLALQLAEAERQHADQLDKSHNQLLELEADEEKIQEALRNPALQRAPELRPPLQEALTRARARRQRATAHHQALSEGTEHRNKLEKLRLDFQRAEQDFEITERNAQYRAPLPGQLHWHPLPHAPESSAPTEPNTPPATRWCEGGELLGEITNRSRYEILIPASTRALQLTPLRSLHVELPTHLLPTASPEAPPLTAPFLEERNLSPGTERSQMAIFELTPRQDTPLQDLTTSSPLVKIYSTLNEPAHLVEKEFLITHRQPSHQANYWAQIVTHLWPGARVLAEGPRALAVAPKKP